MNQSSPRNQNSDAIPDALLTRDEVADILSISLRHLDTLVASGEITPVRIGRAVRFRPETVKGFIRDAVDSEESSKD